MTTVLSLILKIVSSLPLKPEKRLDPIRTIPYLFELEHFDSKLILELSGCEMPIAVEKVLNGSNIPVISPSLDFDLRDLFRIVSDGSNIFLVLVLSSAAEGPSGGVDNVSGRSLKTPSEHSPFVGINTPLKVDGSPIKVDGSDRQTITEISSVNNTTINRQVQLLASQYTKAFEFLCAGAVQSFLPSVLGIEFRLRDPEMPSRSLNDSRILEIVRGIKRATANMVKQEVCEASEKGKEAENISGETRLNISESKPDSSEKREKKEELKKQHLSQECDIYGYVDYYDESRIEINESPILASIGQPDLAVCPLYV